MKKNETDLLPVGSVAYLEEGTAMVVILARGQLVEMKDKESKSAYYDYLGGFYPQGFDPENSYYFNQGDIREVVFTGLQNEDDRVYLEMLEAWKKEHMEDFILGKTETR
ncbi:DUF4176 domain-containing protein [Lactovum odontotermitis]